MTSPETLKRLRELSRTHPKLFEQLTVDEITPHTYTKARASKPKKDRVSQRKVKAEVEVESNDQHDDDDEPAFSPEFDDSCDIPLDALVEHIITEELIEGLKVGDDGSLQRSVDEVPDDAELESTALDEWAAKPVAHSRSGRALRPSVWYQKDWIYTADDDGVEDDKQKKAKAKGKGKGKERAGK